jgi:aromatic-L-amino-acid decarboxylase
MSSNDLDPSDWQAFRALGHRMLDDMLDRLEGARTQPVWRPLGNDRPQCFAEGVPWQGEGFEGAYQRFRADVMGQHPMWNTHPRFWGWMMGSGTPFGMLGDMLVAGLNINAGGGDLISTTVEDQLLRWFKQLLGFPEHCSGLLTTGCSEANFIGIAVARNDHLGVEIVKSGLTTSNRRLRLYCSTQAHGSIRKAASLLGLGTDAVCTIGVDDDFCMRVDELEQAIERDREAGFEPFCVVASVGTINTGAIDPLAVLAEVCERHRLWLHVDAAFGAMCAMSETLRHRVEGLGRAHSIATDLHKGFHMPYEVGLALVTKPTLHGQTFAMAGDYLEHPEPWYCDYGIQLSRRFRAGSVWMCMRAFGVEQLIRCFEQNIAQAQQLAEVIATAPGLELLRPPTLNIVCFRAVCEGLDADGHRELNRRLLMRMWGSGTAIVSTTELHGHMWLRIALNNHRSSAEDLELFIQRLQRFNHDLDRPAA